MSLSLTVLGCDGGYPGPGGAGSGYLVSTPSLSLCLDLGPGVLSRLQSHLDLAELGAVVISHEHPDHCADLDGLAVALHFADQPRRVPVFAPASVRPHLYFSDWPELDWQIVADGDEVEVAGVTLRFSRTDHDPETLAVRLDGDGRSIGYSADTGPDWALDALGPGLDLALCEATWTTAQEGRARHLSGRQAGASGRRARVGQLVITHRWPTIAPLPVAEEAANAFGQMVQTACAGATYTLAGAPGGPGDGGARTP
ncbi:MAG: MBL fold metallo-hydrolase [Candidatus Dormibacteria bacterium]